MYRVIAYDEPTDKAGYVVHDPVVGLAASEGKLTMSSSQANTLSLTLNQANKLFGKVRPMHTHVEVYDSDNSKLLFRGRALKPEREMKSNGQFSQTYDFEDIDSYLIDSVQRYIEIANATPEEFLKKLIEEHNSQVPEYKQFTVRKVTVTNKKDNTLRKVDYQTTKDAIKKLLIDSIGGSIIVEYKDGKNYIDYLKSPGQDHSMEAPLKIAENMQSAKVAIDPSKVITRLVPLGAQIETQKPDEKHDDSSDDGTKLSGPMHAINGDWGPSIKFAAKCMKTSVSDAEVSTIKDVIRHESNGSETIVNNWDSNAAAGHPSKGLLQFIEPTFKAYAIEGYTDILKGFDQLLAMFNDSNWNSDVHTGGWGPTGSKRYDKLPVDIVPSGTGGGWGSPFPSAGHGSFSGGQLFGVHAGGEFRQNGFHDGLDFGSVDHPGSDVHAIHGGKVTKIGYMGGLGNYFVTHSDDGYNIDYQEAFGSRSNIHVNVGQYVKTGQVVGTRTTDHLHIGITKKDFDYALRYAFTNNGTWIDPEPLIFGGSKQTRSLIKKNFISTKTDNSNSSSTDNSNSPLAKQGLDIQAGIDMFNKAKAAHLEYAMDYRRADILTDQKHADCSSFVSFFVELAIHETDRTLYNTETLHGFLKNHGYILHYEGTNKTLPAMQTGDVIIMGKKGQSAGAAGHTAVMKDADTVLECSSGWPGGYPDGADVFEHGKSSNPTLTDWFSHDANNWSGEWYWYLYRFSGNIPEQDSGDQKGGTIKSGVRYTIAPVNDGKDYLDIPEFQNEFGIINGEVTWDDIKDPAKLLAKGKTWIKAQKASTNTFTVSAIELKEYERFKVYDRYLFINPYVAEQQLLTVIGKEIDLNKPHKSTMTFGDKTTRLTDYQNDLKKVSKDVESLKSTISTIGGDVSSMRAGTSSVELATISEQLGTVDVPQLKKDYEGTQKDIEDSKTRLDTAETDLKTVKKDDETTKQTLADYQKTIADLDERLKKLEGGNTNGTGV
ncbi:phage tail protein [Pediococcus pentosaceus]|uniref:peptidoglycan amidohydrolase family protein n=1 Tax=Pediococcus pentosaceus TaxID=1255 RepID=UPI0018FE8B2A|nr:phage tail protein [Pediococcus pentosaceus]MBF7131089.1 phage tail protein [Pediococcus pentosaceus]